MKQQPITIIDSTCAVPADAITLDTGKEINKQTLLSALAQACNFPDYFGYNWDSAQECLRDSNIENLFLDISQAQHIEQSAIEIFIDIISDNYQENNQPKLWLKTNTFPHSK